MAYIKLPELEEMDPEIQELAKEILKKTGKLGEIFQLLAIRKDIYFMTDNCVKTLLLKETELPYSTKERIALLISKENNCPMCVDVHKNIAKMLGMSEEQIEETLKGVDHINTTEEEKELLRFCIRASRKDNYKMTKEDIDRILSLGYTVTQLVEAITITAYFNYINTLSNVFGLGK
ncbi:MAG TPA: alkylhydroperoxidase [Persephonella sp.]|uniref:Alkylhydroperoxidase AhpD core n=1 Tax=Persephonella marina (strain DSM 14350 / EX-H1) TaxID=123214 RepID=C0QQG9_PERMH|nr:MULTISPECIES: carboxymuconolactone decarboxylase family protein [Persephonella]ACO04042.1 alkylhydroperoxidase AhpD core [Persephonella marina EX-H1]HCB69479.1 alkylhydroperoxidase [Persephonella sp.]